MIPRFPAVVLLLLLSSCTAQAGIIASAWEIGDDAAVLSQWRGLDIDQDEADPHFSQASDELASVSPPPSGGGLAATVDSVPIPDATGLQRRLYITNDVRPLAPFHAKLPKPA